MLKLKDVCLHNQCVVVLYVALIGGGGAKGGGAGVYVYPLLYFCLRLR